MVVPVRGTVLYGDTQVLPLTWIERGVNVTVEFMLAVVRSRGVMGDEQVVVIAVLEREGAEPPAAEDGVIGVLGPFGEIGGGGKTAAAPILAGCSPMVLYHM